MRPAQQIKPYAVTLNGSVVSTHTSHAACIAAMKYLKRLNVCMDKWRAHYTYEEASAMRIAHKKDGFIENIRSATRD